MTSEKLHRRKHILEQLGFQARASRASWSHDFGDAVVFDAWDHHWERGSDGELLRYPLRTGSHYNLQDSIKHPRPGHTRWQKHVDLALAGKRKIRAIIPIAVEPQAQPNKRAKGWRPLVLDGTIIKDDREQVWFMADQVTRLRDISAV